VSNLDKKIIKQDPDEQRRILNSKKITEKKIDNYSSFTNRANTVNY
jgi:hypothetical protein